KSEALDSLNVSFDPGDAADLIRTDSYYPGWRAFSAGSELNVKFEPPCFSRIHIPVGATEVRFIYEPRHWRTGLVAAASAAVILSVWLGTAFQRRKTT